MKHLSNFKLFLENTNSGKTVNGSSKSPSEDSNNNIDSLLDDAEEKKQTILLQKDTIEKTLLKDIKKLEPDNQKEVKTQVDNYKSDVEEFDKTINNIKGLNDKLKKQDKPKIQNNMQKAREKAKL